MGRWPSKSKGLEVGMGQVGLPAHELLADFHSPRGWPSAWSLWRSLLTLWQLVGASLSAPLRHGQPPLLQPGWC